MYPLQHVLMFGFRIRPHTFSHRMLSVANNDKTLSNTLTRDCSKPSPSTSRSLIYFARKAESVCQSNFEKLRVVYSWKPTSKIR